jgi:hypothetical protein
MNTSLSQSQWGSLTDILDRNGDRVAIQVFKITAEQQLHIAALLYRNRDGDMTEADAK